MNIKERVVAEFFLVLKEEGGYNLSCYREPDEYLDMPIGMSGGLLEELLKEVTRKEKAILYNTGENLLTLKVIGKTIILDINKNIDLFYDIEKGDDFYQN